MKFAVYTSITGGYESLQVPTIADSRLDYFCFTDNPSSVIGPWRARDISLLPFPPRDKNRYVKMHPFEFLMEYDASLYIDGSIRIVGDIHSLIQEALRSAGSVFMYEHPERKCAYQEAKVVAAISHDWIWNIARQMKRYHQEGFPAGLGLFEANVIIRRHDERARSLMQLWWNEYMTGVRRDQLSLTYCAWRQSTAISSLGASDVRFKGRHFSFATRKRRRSVRVSLRKYINKSIGYAVGYRRLFGSNSGFIR